MIFAIGLVAIVIAWLLVNGPGKASAVDRLLDNYNGWFYTGGLFALVGFGCVLFSVGKLAVQYLP